MTLALLFVVLFLGGPLVFRRLMESGPGMGSQRRLMMGTFGCAASGIALRYGAADQWGQDIPMTVISIALIWFAWIGVLAFGAQAFRLADGGMRMRRWTGLIGAAGTTVPWFGLASANLVQG